MQSEKNFRLLPDREELEALRTPCYIIDKEIFRTNLDLMYRPFARLWKQNIRLGYSIKTNHFPALLKMAANYGMMAEAVSDEEYKQALKVGFSGDGIIFNGPQKTEEQLIRSLNCGSIVNLDNMDELQMIEDNIARLQVGNIKLGIRVNFDLESRCPGETSAGAEVSRFGICVENNDFAECVRRLAALGIPVSGLHMHYSSRSRSLTIFQELAGKACDLVSTYGLEPTLTYIDIGGGFFGGQVLSGKPTMEEYAQVITSRLRGTVDCRRVTLILEPGASALATAVYYLTKVINVRDIRGISVATVDGTLLHVNPLMVPRTTDCKLLSESREFVPVQLICGSTCMEQDRLLRLEQEQRAVKGDYIYCFCQGAYTMCFNSCFINLPPCVYTRENRKYTLCREQKEELWMEI